MINYAHRGASAYAPENTMAAFFLGLEMGANGIETDVRKTADGQLVLAHDSSLKRTTGLDSSIEECSYLQLLQLDFGMLQGKHYHHERIVLFEDFLKYFSGKNLHFAIELKEHSIETNVVDAIYRHNCMEKCIITSFSLDILLGIRTFDHSAALGHLCDDITNAHISILLHNNILQICPKASFVSPDKVILAQQHGLSVRAWGVEDEQDMQRMIECGVDGMTVDFPDKLTAAMKRSNCSYTMD